ncbi:MAG: nicotinamide-nucleotide adenylyltransferase [Nitrososphaeraceae archaeon]
MSKTGLFIGRFQPFHLGHLESIKFALDKVDTLIIVIGSAQKSHEKRNPFTAGERIQMIRNTLYEISTIDLQKIIFIPIPDNNIHLLWTYNIDILVPQYDIVFTNDPFTIFLFQERHKNVIKPKLYNRNIYSGTMIRKFMIDDNDKWKNLVHKEVFSLIDKIKGVERLQLISKLHENEYTDHKKH